MKELTERQQVIHALVVGDYIDNAQPVGSERLVKLYGLSFSSATVRSEMAALTEAGYLRQPHTSAGRIPTEEGYRYFVRRLMGNTDLPQEIRHTIQHQFYQARHDIDQWMRLAASVLARQSKGASIVTALHPDRAKLKHIELINTRGRQVLMVLVLEGGEVLQQMLVLAEPVTQEALSSVAENLSNITEGYEVASIKNLLKKCTDPLEEDIIKLIVDEMNQSDNLLSGEIYQDGLSHVLSEPEFAAPEAAQRAIRVLEERSVLSDLLSQTVLAPQSGGVHVLIGGEGTWDELKECSMVLARYGIPGTATGALGVLGPTRMPYAHAISTVRFVSGLLSELVEVSFSE